MPGGQHAAPLINPEEIALWENITSHEGITFTTSGRGARPGIQFTYTIRGAEMFVSSRSKSITRSTILFAYHKVKGKEITGPKMIGVHGDSYIYAVFKGLGVIGNPKDLGLTDKFLIPIIESGEMCREGNEVPMRTISYDPLWKTLIDKKMNKKDLTAAAGLAKGTITRMGKNESVTDDVLVKICNAVDCDVVDVLEIR